MSIKRDDISGVPDGYVKLAPVEEIRAEAQWAASALVNSAVEKTGQGIYEGSREQIESNTAEFLENRALEDGLDIHAFNEKLFQARTGRALLDDVTKDVGLERLSQSVDKMVHEETREHSLQGLEEAQRLFDVEEYIDYQADVAAKLLTNNEDLSSDENSVSTVKRSLVLAAKYTDFNLDELIEKLEVGKALNENDHRKTKELKTYGELRGRPEFDHLQDIKKYQALVDQRLSNAEYVAKSAVETDSPGLSNANKYEAEASLTEKLIRADIKGEIDLAGMKVEIAEQKVDLSDEIPF